MRGNAKADSEMVDRLLQEEMRELDQEMDEDERDDGIFSNEEDDADDPEGREGLLVCADCGIVFSGRKVLAAHAAREHSLSEASAAARSAAAVAHRVSWACEACVKAHLIFADVEHYKTHLLKAHGASRRDFASDDPEENPLLRPVLIEEKKPGANKAAINGNASTALPIKTCDACKMLFAGPAFLEAHSSSSRCAGAKSSSVSVGSARSSTSSTSSSGIDTAANNTPVAKAPAGRRRSTPPLKEVTQVAPSLLKEAPAPPSEPPGCPVCNKRDVGDLTAHVRSAHGVDGVVCPHCGKLLSKKCTLNRHIEQVHLHLQIHKPATCTQCGKIFSKKGHLDRHIKTIHMGIKDESEPCPYCGKVFSTKSSLEPHIDMVHKGVRRECTECGKVLSDLWKHMRTVHGFYRRRTKIPKEGADGSMDDDGEDYEDEEGEDEDDEDAPLKERVGIFGQRRTSAGASAAAKPR